jgi:lipoate-protein ligase B
LGRRASVADLRVPAPVLAEHGIACVATERGGQATYHGPGQIVLYPIVDLRARDLTVGHFIWMLEEIIIETARAAGVAAARDPRGRGAWTSHGKLGAVGIRVRRNVTTHGLALNVDPDLTPFSLIVPCGMPDAPVTSLAREGACETTVAAVLPLLRAACTALSRPDDGFSTSSDLDASFLGRLNTVYGGPGSAPAGTYQGHYGYLYE